MTGDGAVVRVDRALQYARRHLVQHKDYKLPCGACDLARAYLAQAERLTRERDEEKERADGNYQSFERVRTARADAESRAADLLKALERYGRHSSNCALEMGEEWRGCTCGFAEGGEGRDGMSAKLKVAEKGWLVVAPSGRFLRQVYYNKHLINGVVRLLRKTHRTNWRCARATITYEIERTKP